MEGAQKSAPYRHWVSLLLVAMALLVGLFIGSLASLIVGKALCIAFGNQVDIFALAENPTAYPGYQPVLLAMQGAYSLVAFLVTPFFTIKWLDQFSLPSLHFKKMPWATLIPFTLLILFVYFPFSSFLVGLNQNIQFPETWKALEQALRQQEDYLREVTLYLTSFDTVWQYALGMLVIAVIPAIGEEYVFRGLLQHRLQLLTKNVHIAIWVGAFVFSVFHQQFYGILPRMVLGGLFGYLYIWSGSLWIPIIAHFFNNGFTLSMMYLYATEGTSFDIEEAENVPWPLALLSFALIIVLLRTFQKRYDKRPEK